MTASANVFINATQHTDGKPSEFSEKFCQRLLSISHIALITSVTVTLLSIVLGYIVHENLPFGMQLGAHIALIIAVTGIKLAYIARCVALQGLGIRQL